MCKRDLLIQIMIGFSVQIYVNPLHPIIILFIMLAIINCY